MSKELKPLEAWDKIKTISLSHIEVSEDENFDGEWEYSYYEEDDGDIEYNFPNECSIIETALKKLEIYDNVEKKIEETTPNKCILNDDGSIEIEGSDYLMLVPKKEYQKKLKTLEIIKNKQVDVGALCELDLELYNQYVNEINGTPTLTKKEYDLLRKVLL